MIKNNKEILKKILKKTKRIKNKEIKFYYYSIEACPDDIRAVWNKRELSGENWKIKKWKIKTTEKDLKIIFFLEKEKICKNCNKSLNKLEKNLCYECTEDYFICIVCKKPVEKTEALIPVETEEDCAMCPYCFDYYS